MKFNDILLRKIFDSRGNPTIEAEVRTGRGAFRASVPAGKSTGKYEAEVFGFEKARAVLKSRLAPKLKKFDIRSGRQLDEFMLRLDGTARKERLGGNLTLALSIAGTRALAAEKGEELWQYLKREFFRSERDRKPMIFSNVVNGGLHAKNNLQIQEFMVLVKPGGNFADGITRLVDFYRDLGSFLAAKYKLPRLSIGDEGGYSLDFKNNFEPIAVLDALIRRLRLSEKFRIGLDCAASNFSSGERYRFDGKKLSRVELAKVYAGYFTRSKLLYSIEDPFGEEDQYGFDMLRKIVPNAVVVGDDLIVTNPKRLQLFAESGAVNGVIIKANQVGTLTETCEAMRVAKRHNVKTIVSHRSGETEDVFLVHLAKAASADGLKIGAPAKERLLKFNEAVRLYS